MDRDRADEWDLKHQGYKLVQYEKGVLDKNEICVFKPAIREAIPEKNEYGKRVYKYYDIDGMEYTKE